MIMLLIVMMKVITIMKVIMIMKLIRIMMLIMMMWMTMMMKVIMMMWVTMMMAVMLRRCYGSHAKAERAEEKGDQKQGGFYQDNYHDYHQDIYDDEGGFYHDPLDHDYHHHYRVFIIIIRMMIKRISEAR